MKRVLVAIAALVLGISSLAAEDEKAREKKVRKLFELSGGTRVAREQVEALVQQIEANPDHPPGFARKARQLARPEEVVDYSVAIWMKHFEESEIDALIAFYESPAGKAFAREQPLIQKESFEAGRKWGKGLREKILAELEREKK